jgi:putative PIN family toxin of toxin-antitoxin system
LRVVLDTNVLLSGLAYPNSIPGKTLAAWRFGSLEVVLPTFILEELRRVLPRLAHRYGLNAQQIDDLIDILSVKAEIVEPSTTNEARLRDPNDQPILGSYLVASLTGMVHYLISEDKDLLALNPPTPVFAPTEFWDRHKGFG